ncbi:MAG: hypothetical protein AB8F78_15525 [Saprospiraceae bacterium]
MMCLFASLLSANNIPANDSLKLSYKNELLIQLGVRYRHAVRFELEVPTLELLVQPIEHVSMGVRVGQVKTQTLQDLFAGRRGRMQGFVFRVNFPHEGKLDVYAEVAVMKGSLSFSRDVYGIAPPDAETGFSPSSTLSGKVSFRQNQLQVGIRQHFCRYFFVDGSIGVVDEQFILASEGLKNAASAIGFIIDTVDQLPPNEWHKNFAPRVGFSVGVRF